MEKVFIGIDISKLTLDVFVKCGSKTQHYQIENNSKAIKKFFKSFSNTADTIVGMENTGRYLKNHTDKEIIKLNKQLILLLYKQIKPVEKKIVEIIESNVELKDQYKRIQTVPGVGKVLATMLIVKTNGFTEIQSARKMACYSGVVPFEHRSGSSIYYKPRVSTMADKELKKILHLAALSSIRLKNDLASYFQRKVLEGKNKMSVLNAIRNKIIHRVYALIKNNSVYENKLLMS